MRNWELDLSKWTLSSELGETTSLCIRKNKNRLFVKNAGTAAVILAYKKDVLIEETCHKWLKISFWGKNIRNGGACLYINNHPVVLNGVSSMVINAPCNLHLTLKVPADSEVEVTGIALEALEAWPEALDAGLRYIEKKAGDCAVIMRCYHNKIDEDAEKRTPIIGGTQPMIQNNLTAPVNRNWIWYLKAVIKACIPYGIMKVIIRSRHLGIVFPG